MESCKQLYQIDGSIAAIISFPINESNVDLALKTLNLTEEELTEDFYDLCTKNKLIIKDVKKFNCSYRKAYMKILTDSIS